jgi:hypothetical protein
MIMSNESNESNEVTLRVSKVSCYPFCRRLVRQIAVASGSIYFLRTVNVLR